MKENRSSLALLDREEAELLPVRETLFGDVTITTVVGINLALAVGGIGGRVTADAGQLLGLR